MRRKEERVEEDKMEEEENRKRMSRSRSRRRARKRRRKGRRRKRSLGTFTGGLAMGLGPEAAVTLALVRSRQVDTQTSHPTDVLPGALIHIWPVDGRNVLVFDVEHTAGGGNIFPGRPLTDTLGPPVHQLLVTLATEAVVADRKSVV